MRRRLSVISGLALLSVAVLRLSLAALGALPVPAPQPEPHGWPDSLAERRICPGRVPLSELSPLRRSQ